MSMVSSRNECDYEHESQWVNDYEDAVTYCMASAIEDALRRPATDSGRSHGLDIGCGQGESTRVASRFVDHIIGIDSSAERIQSANDQKLEAKFEFLHCDFREFRVPHAPFDLVTATSYLDRLDTESELDATFNAIVESIKPAGAVVFVVPSAWIANTRWSPFTLMRKLDVWFDVWSLDVKKILVQQPRLPDHVAEPPFEVIVGRCREIAHTPKRPIQGVRP